MNFQKKNVAKMNRRYLLFLKKFKKIDMICQHQIDSQSFDKMNKSYEKYKIKVCHRLKHLCQEVLEQKSAIKDGNKVLLEPYNERYK